jgi:hypothetical protein
MVALLGAVMYGGETVVIVDRRFSGLYVPSHASSDEHDPLRPWSADDYAAQLEGLRFFADHPDIHCIWEFRPAEGSLPGLALEPGSGRLGGTDYWLVCPFVDGKLVIHSPVALHAGNFHFALSHSVLFDSNLYARIVRFVNEPELLTKDERTGVVRLLNALIVRRYDFQMLPYIVESVAMNTFTGSYAYAHRAMKAVLQLHMMDRERFRSNESIVRDEGLAEQYAREFGTSDLDEIAAHQLEPYRQHEHVPSMVTVNLVALMKMVLIRKAEMPRKGPAAQWAAFDDFMFGTFGIHAATLRFLALSYFAGVLDGWIRIQRGSSVEKAIEDLENSAWDLFLAALPQQILAGSPPEHATICHFCTREAELARFVGTFQVVMLRVFADRRFHPFIAYDFGPLKHALGEERVEKLLVTGDGRIGSFLRTRSDARPALDESTLLAVLESTRSAFLTAIGNDAHLRQ